MDKSNQKFPLQGAEGATSQKFPLQGAEGATFASQVARRQPEAIARLNQMYQQLFNQDIKKGCGNCYNKAYLRIQKQLYLQNNTDADNAQPRYQLKPDRCLQSNFGGDAITNANLTDEIAEQLLKAHPNLIKHFDKHP